MCLHCFQVNVYKDPITDKVKKSKKGRLALENHDGTYVTREEGAGDCKKVSTINHLSTTKFSKRILLQSFKVNRNNVMNCFII